MIDEDKMKNTLSSFSRLSPLKFRNMLYYLVLISFSTLASCKREYDCDKANLILSFNGKTADSLSDFTIYKFEKGTNFVTLSIA